MIGCLNLGHGLIPKAQAHVGPLDCGPNSQSSQVLHGLVRALLLFQITLERYNLNVTARIFVLVCLTTGFGSSGFALSFLLQLQDCCVREINKPRRMDVSVCKSIRLKVTCWTEGLQDILLVAYTGDDFFRSLAMPASQMTDGCSCSGRHVYLKLQARFVSIPRNKKAGV